MKPTRKVQNGGIAGAAVVILVWIVGMFGLAVPAEVASAFTVLAATGVAYLTRDG
jgi:hypothetical protein